MFNHNHHDKIKDTHSYGIALILISVLYLCSSIFNAQASDSKLYGGFLDLEFKMGTERNVGRVDVFLPLLQNPNSLLFTNLKGMATDEDNQEYNFGLGYRHKFAEKVVVGFYAFYDLLRTKSSTIQQQILDVEKLYQRKLNGYKNLEQVSGGIEFLTENWELRANYYKPLDDSKIIERNTDKNGIIVGNDILVSQDVLQIAYSGFDVEIGRRFMDRAGIYATYYQFESEADKKYTRNSFKDVGDFDGYRVRGEVDLLKKSKFNVILSAEYSDDDVRGDNTFVGLNFRFKFGGSGSDIPKTKLEERMTNKVIRDLDIVNQIVAPGRQLALDDYGQTQKIYFVAPDVTPGTGSGTENDPFSLYDVLDGYRVDRGAIIYLTQGEYKIDGNVQLKEGQKLYGVSSDLMVENVIVKSAGAGESTIKFILDATEADPGKKYATGIAQNDFSAADSDRASGEYTGAMAGITLANGNAIRGIRFDDQNKDIQSYVLFGSNVHNIEISDNIFETYNIAIGLQYNRPDDTYVSRIYNNSFSPIRIAHLGGAKIIASGPQVRASTFFIGNTFGIVGRNVQDSVDKLDMRYYQGSLALIAEQQAVINAMVLNNHFGTTSTLVNTVAHNRATINANISNNTVETMEALSGNIPQDSQPFIIDVATEAWINAVVKNNTITEVSGTISPNGIFTINNHNGTLKLDQSNNSIPN